MDASQRSDLMETSALPGGSTPSRPNDEDVLTGYRAFAEFSTGEGFPVSHSTMQKYCSPAVASGPTITGYWGIFPTSTKGLIRAWIKSRHRAKRPASRRWPAKTEAA